MRTNLNKANMNLDYRICFTNGRNSGLAPKKDKVLKKRKNKHPKKLQGLLLSTVADPSDFAC